MEKINRFGLSREIPDPIRQEIRKRSGFGCVVCGCAIIQYHHFNPPFPEAKSHTSEGITALCPLCHTKVTSGRISSSALLNAVRQPHAYQVGYSSDNLECSVFPTVVLGGLTIKSTPIILEVAGRTLLGFSPPESPNAPFGLNAQFCDINGKTIAEIVDNQWRAFVHNWDVNTIGPRTIIRGGYRDIALVFRTEPPSTIVIERINMFYKGLRLEGQEGSHLSAYLPNGDLWFRATNTASITGCSKGIVFD